MSYELLKEQLTGIVPNEIFNLIINYNITDLREIRMRAGKIIVLVSDTRLYKTNIYASKEDILNSITNASCSSIYAYIDEIKNGFITIKGGHRIGICGRVVIKNGDVSNIVDFSGVNIRIAKEIKGCAKKLMDISKGESTLIISPPGFGKTTILRDMSRILGENHNVCIIDERNEISASYRGISQFDIGLMTDVLDLCPKKIGIEITLRGMSPEYIVTDEIGKDDITAVSKGLLCGVKFILTAHGSNIYEAITRLEFERVADKFGCIALIGKNGVISDCIKGNDLFERAVV